MWIYNNLLIHTCTSSSLLLKCDTSTFSPSVTRVREMPRRPVALAWASGGIARCIMDRRIFTRLKEGCMGPRKRFWASLAISMKLAPTSPVTRPERQQATGECYAMIHKHCSLWHIISKYRSTQNLVLAADWTVIKTPMVKYHSSIMVQQWYQKVIQKVVPMPVPWYKRTP